MSPNFKYCFLIGQHSNLDSFLRTGMMRKRPIFSEKYYKSLMKIKTVLYSEIILPYQENANAINKMDVLKIKTTFPHIVSAAKIQFCR
jgi:hypothetical protein